MVTISATCLPARALIQRREFFYWTDDGNFAGLRYDQYKAVFMEQPAHGLEVWIEPFVPLRAPKLFNLRSDPFERAEHEAGDYDRWFIEHIFVLVPAQAIVGQFLATFQEFPPRQKPGSFSVDQALQKLTNQVGSNCRGIARKDRKMKKAHSTSFAINRRTVTLDVGATTGLFPDRCLRPPRRQRPNRRPAYCHHGTTGRRSRRSSTSCATRRTGKSELRAARGAHSHIRSGWHALGRAPDVQPNGVLPRPGSGARCREAGAET